ncbi:HAD hydrolase-like protein [Cellulomonas shaoxiangyii]|uniref:HAD family hydrolase n=1 Tax=Cellulomonas shaoxiangyii TaxID=2566013 RepID=A0A4P7SJJ8_9CELL|nr:HAD hydrolase-like protein [Cellulomonas shaoxiangyii]QCB94001.1 HAD family hydrolase [Cellulomonas shaoxiangyii]TGY83015.1 HAD family hydrolase [Cellulomonas shaoxiangyii]
MTHPPLPAPRPLVLLDLDGTLMDSAPGVLSSVRAAYGHLGVPAPADAVMRTFVGPPIRRSFTAHGVAAEHLADVVAVYNEHFGRVGVWDTTVFDGVPEALRTLRDAGALLVVATAKPVAWAVPICAEVGLTPLLDAVVGAPADESESKAQIMGRAIAWVRSTTGVDPDPARTVMVGDREHDVEGAHAHGIACVGVGWGYGGEEELLRAGAAEVVHDVADLAPRLLHRLGLPAPARPPS